MLSGNTYLFEPSTTADQDFLHLRLREVPLRVRAQHLLRVLLDCPREALAIPRREPIPGRRQRHGIKAELCRADAISPEAPWTRIRSHVLGISEFIHINTPAKLELSGPLSLG